MIGKLFLVLLVAVIVVADNIKQSEIIYFSTTKKTINKKQKIKPEDTHYIKGYWQNRIDRVSKKLNSKPKNNNKSKETMSFADKYLDTKQDTQSYTIKK